MGGVFFAGAGIVEAVDEGIFRVDVHKEQILLELLRAGNDATVRVENDGAAIENELVLAPDQVAKDDVAAVV
jgi:hypothetical protein